MKKIIFLLVTLAFFYGTSFSQTTSFTYQGKLTDAGNPPTAQYDLIFRLFDASGTQIGTDQAKDDVQVTIGIFTVALDFGASPFTGTTADSLEIAVRPGASTGAYTTLTPRQPLTSSPYAIKSTNATSANTATNSTQLGGVAANQYVITNDPRMTDARMPTAGSADYIQNRTTPQALSDFNVSGNGAVGGVFATGSGSAAAPSMTFSGDTDTGFFRSAPDTLRFSTGGISRMVIDPNGRIGVGTEIATSPTRFFALEDNPSAATAYGVYGRATGTTGSRVGVLGQSLFTAPQTGTTIGWGVYGSASGGTINVGINGIAQGVGTTNTGVYGTASGATRNWAGYFDGNTYFSNPGIARAYINSDANAGIALTLNDQPGWSVATANTGHFQIFNDAIGQNAFWIDKTTNNTGIGTFTPSAKLDVAGDVNTSTQYNIGGNRVLNNAGTNNLFAGQGTGTLGSNNAFFGSTAGASTTAFSGSNSFFGSGAGFSNADGSNNAFFGTSAGGNSSGPIANANTFIGSGAGMGNTTGRTNTMLGFQANMPFPSGLINATAIGTRAFVTQDNSLVLGGINGVNGATADTNVGIGTTAPIERLHVVGNQIISGNLTVAGTITGTVATANNALNLGGVPANQFVQTNDSRLSDARIPLPNSGNYIQNSLSTQSANFSIIGNGSVFGTLSGNTVNSNTQYNIGGTRVLGFAPGNPSSTFVGSSSGSNTTAGSNSFFGSLSGQNTTNGQANSFFGVQAGQNSNGSSNSFFGVNTGAATTGSDNAFFGEGAGVSNTTGGNNTLIGANVNVGAGNLTFATAVGSDATVSTSNTIVLGRSNRSDTVQIPGLLNLGLLGSPGFVSLCYNNGLIATCSSSRRYKTNISAFSRGLAIVRQLKPVSFNWKQGGMPDMGLVAEEVAEVEPLLVTHNDKGQIEGVKYDRVGVVLINAVKEQQSQIERLKQEVETLKTLVCSINQTSEICKKKER